MRYSLRLDLADAKRIAREARARAKKLGIFVSVVVLHDSGQLIYLERQDRAQFQTPEVAKGKALTAVMMRKPSKDIEDATLSRPTLATFHDGRLPIQGGYPLVSEDVRAGAIGVSGGTPDQDDQIAHAGAQAL
ncbi:hypothetical protein WM40_26020 [Robbsia andropogonis]|uniref:GlcG protein n=1 Tax=Robbsia andropogonis TaxID=28092 RepID=A0A0F5JTJ0_9BURK|nr:heme-binding protein [Robbsia andropogonis]KKB60970.1 hypothetical protein WM40_26020 [Robbsia andropogonis]